MVIETIETYSNEETFKVGVGFANRIYSDKNTNVVCLTGDLGVGKTVFSKGFGLGLGVTEEITSPTFSIINEYIGKANFYHFDVYRIIHLSEMEDTGYEDYFYGKGICLIEWAEMIEPLIPKNALWIKIEKDYQKGDNYRKITVNNFLESK